MVQTTVAPILGTFAPSKLGCHDAMLLSHFQQHHRSVRQRLPLWLHQEQRSDVPVEGWRIPLSNTDLLIHKSHHSPTLSASSRPQRKQKIGNPSAWSDLRPGLLRSSSSCLRSSAISSCPKKLHNAEILTRSPCGFSPIVSVFNIHITNLWTGCLTTCVSTLMQWWLA